MGRPTLEDNTYDMSTFSNCIRAAYGPQAPDHNHGERRHPCLDHFRQYSWVTRRNRRMLQQERWHYTSYRCVSNTMRLERDITDMEPDWTARSSRTAGTRRATGGCWTTRTGGTSGTSGRARPGGSTGHTRSVAGDLRLRRGLKCCKHRRSCWLPPCASKTLPAGNWAIQANVITEFLSPNGDAASDCQLRVNGTQVIGGAADERSAEDKALATLSMNGGVSVASGSATVDVFCRGAHAGSAVAQIMAIQVGGFF